MNRLTPPRALGRWLVGLPLLAALLLGGWTCYHAALEQPEAPLDLEGWDVPRLAEHLRSQGLPLRLVPSDEAGTRAASSAFLTTTDRTWRELNGLNKSRERIDGWKGTLHCERLNRIGALDWQTAFWGDCCLEAGPFILFGDRDLLARVADALRLPRRRDSACPGLIPEASRPCGMMMPSPRRR